MGTVTNFPTQYNDVVRCTELRYMRVLLKQLNDVSIQLRDQVEAHVEKYGECDATLLAAMQVLGYELQNQAFLATPAAIKLETAILALVSLPEIEDDMRQYAADSIARGYEE